MEIFKVFPLILLDLLSKILPGIIFVAIFKNSYLPPEKLLANILGFNSSLPPEWKGWYPLAVALATAYFIGVLISIAAHLADIILIKFVWFDKVKSNTKKYTFNGANPPGLLQSLQSGNDFLQYIEYCRNILYANGSSTAFILERYRTSFRVFFSLTVIFPFAPFSPNSGEYSYVFILLAPAVALLSIFLSNRYLDKTIQNFLIRDINGPEKVKKTED